MMAMPAEVGEPLGWSMPYTLGHETAGWVDRIGPGTAAGVAEGDAEPQAMQPEQLHNLISPERRSLLGKAQCAHRPQLAGVDVTTWSPTVTATVAIMRDDGAAVGKTGAVEVDGECGRVKGLTVASGSVGGRGVHGMVDVDIDQ